MVKDIATTKMELHPYTVRKDALPEFFTDVNQMYDALLNKAGATGVFTDFPDLGVQFLENQKNISYFLFAIACSKGVIVMFCASNKQVLNIKAP